MGEGQEDGAGTRGWDRDKRVGQGLENGAGTRGWGRD